MVVEQFFFRGRLPYTWRHKTPDHACMKKASECKKIDYPKPDGVISFDKLSSVFLSNTTHEEDQPCHLTLKDKDLPIAFTLSEYDEPAQGIVLPVYMRLSLKRMVRIDFKSMRRIVFIVRHVISKNRVKILYGSLPRAEADQIIQICNVCNYINQ